MEENEHDKEQINKSLVALENHTHYINNIENICSTDQHIDQYDVVISYLDQMRLDVINDINTEYISTEVAHVLDDIEKMKIDLQRSKNNRDDEDDNWVIIEEYEDQYVMMETLKRIRKQYGFICSKLKDIYKPIKPFVIALQIIGAIYTNGLLALIPIAWQIID